MMKNSLFLISILSILCITSCQDYSQPISIDNKDFELTLPGFVKEEDLAEDAVVEYANRFRNFYIVVFQFKDASNKDSLWIETTQRITKTLVEHKIDTMHRGSDQIITTIKGKFKDEKEPLFYTQKLIYKQGNSYLITVWTRGQERYKKYETEIGNIISSFKTRK